MEFEIESIKEMIYVVRGQKVMLDSDLAKLYEVETSALNRQVKRNIIRFPEDFMFKLTKEEHGNLKCHFGIPSSNYGGRRSQPYVFTEPGVAMLSSVLRSERAALVNISIMRTFIKLRSFLVMGQDNSNKISSLEIGTNKLFKVVFERLDDLEVKLPSHDKNRRKIGIKNKN